MTLEVRINGNMLYSKYGSSKLIDILILQAWLTITIAMNRGIEEKLKRTREQKELNREQ